MQSTLREPASARVVGRFDCKEKLASDGLLETWRGRLQGMGGFDRVFAVKCLTQGALARRPKAAESLLRAGRNAATLNDPRIAAVIETGLAPGTAFIATELVHGVTAAALRELVHAGELPAK